jgi:hypothetical protein
MMFKWFAIVGFTFSSIFLFTGNTLADTVPGALSFEYFGLNYAENTVTSYSVGTLDYTGGPGCGGVCTASTAQGPGGSDPTVSVTVNEVPYMGGGGGYAEAKLDYYVEYVNPTPGNYTVNLQESDSLNATYPGSAQVYLEVGLAGSNPSGFGNFLGNTPLTYANTDCVNECALGVANYTSPAPFPSSVPLNMVANTAYLVEMYAAVHPTSDNIPMSAALDPTFSTSAAGGYFIYSEVPAVPEPDAWLLILAGSGFFIIGMSAKGRLRQLQARRSCRPAFPII